MSDPWVHMRPKPIEPRPYPKLPRWLVLGMWATGTVAVVGLAIGAAVAWALVRDGLCS